MKTKTYTQCFLQKNSALGTRNRVGWIPTKFAKIGKIVDLKLSGRWSKGWKVTGAWTLYSAEEIETRETDYKRQRIASDI